MKTLINFVLDETGSMSSVKPETIKGFNEYVDGLQEQGNDVSMTLTLFNTSKVEVRFVNKPIKDVPHLDNETYQPNNGTPLYDAIGKTIAKMEHESKNKSQAILVVVMTDGEENSSIEYKQQDILKLINEKTKDGWTFAYLGADPDTWDASQRIGIAQGNVAMYAAAAPDKGMRHLVGATQRYAAMACSPMMEGRSRIEMAEYVGSSGGFFGDESGHSPLTNLPKSKPSSFKKKTNKSALWH